jgi:hypothetical protein
MNDLEISLLERLSSKILAGIKPKIAILMPKSGIVLDDLMGGLGDYQDHYSFVIHKCPMNNPKEIAARLNGLDHPAFDAIALIRGGGNFLESLDTPVVLKAIARLDTPFIVAAGHFVDNPVIQMVASMTCGTPTMLGVELGRIVENYQEDRQVDSSETDQKIQEGNSDIIKTEHENKPAPPTKMSKAKSAFIKMFSFFVFVIAIPLAILYLTSEVRLSAIGAFVGTFVFLFIFLFVSRKTHIRPDPSMINQEFNYSDFFMNEVEGKKRHKAPKKTICKALSVFIKFTAFFFFVLILPFLIDGYYDYENDDVFLWSLSIGLILFACICDYVSKRTYNSSSKKINLAGDGDEDSILNSDGVIDDGLSFLGDDYMFAGVDF